MLAFKSNISPRHADGNSMASPTQMVVSKGKPNLLIAENLVKILRDLIPPISPKSLTNFLQWNGKSTKSCIYFLRKMNYRLNLSC